ncbi:MMPL family transporter [Porticoccaceae bacterium]|nr:MMPL family transporter [Porticoccaceae bacterium]
MTKALLAFYPRIIIDRPWQAIAFVLAVTLMMGMGLPNFKLDASADSLTLEYDEDLNFFREVSKRYGSDNFLIVTFSPKFGELLDDKNLETLSSISKNLNNIKGVDSTLSLLDAPLLYSPKITVGDLEKPLNTVLSEGVDKQLAKQEFLTSPIYKDMLLSADGKTTGIIAKLSLDPQYLELVSQRDSLRLVRDTEGLNSQQQLVLASISQEFLDYRTAKAAEDHRRVAEVRNLMDQYRDQATIYLGGPDMITADMVDFIKSDLAVFGIGILVFMIATLSFIFRSIRWVILPVATCALCLTIVLGLLSWLDWRLTVISSNFVSLLLIITLALTIHLIVRYRELFATKPKADQRMLVTETVQSMAKPCLYTVLTTIVAFSSLVVSNIRPVIDFGWMMTLGIIIALGVSFIILPAGMMILGKDKNTAKKDRSGVITAKFAQFTQQRGSLVLLFALALALLSALGISRLEVDNRFIDYFKSDTEIYRGMEVIDTALGGTTPLDIILQAPAYSPPVVINENDADFDDYEDLDEYGDFDEYEDLDEYEDFETEISSSSNQESYWFSSTGLAELAKLTQYLEAQPEIGKVSSLVQLDQVAADLMGHKLNDFEIAFMRQSLSPEIYQQLVAPYLIEELDETRIQLRAMETAGLKRAELLAKIKQFAINEVGIAEENIRFTGLLVLYNNMLQSLFKSQIMTIGAVFIGIMLMFLVLFRSLKLSFIAVIPNFLAAAVVLGGMGLLKIPLDMMTITIAAITVGIGVDHSIHYITRFKREFSKDGDYIATMHRAHNSIGQALFYTAITIIIGFSVLTLSNFIPSIYFGLLTSVAMIAALLGSMTLLPKLILMIKPLGK